jgi:hypothetical protein
LVKTLQLFTLLLRLDCQIFGYCIDIRHDIGDVVDILLPLAYHVGHEVSVCCHLQLLIRQFELLLQELVLVF